MEWSGHGKESAAGANGSSVGEGDAATFRLSTFPPHFAISFLVVSLHLLHRQLNDERSELVDVRSNGGE